jgi:hypothetical protein
MVWDADHESRFVLEDLLEHPFYWWPRTLLSCRVEFRGPVELDRLALRLTDTREALPIQFSDVKRDRSGVASATLNFFSDLPSSVRREFALAAAAAATAPEPQVKEVREGNTIILDSGAVKVRIPVTQQVQGEAPGPILAMSRGGNWIGASTLRFDNDPIVKVTASRVESGPLFIAYEAAYESQAGSRYVARVQCDAGMDFVRFNEDMEGMKPETKGQLTSSWTGFAVTHRQAPNHPYPTSGKIRKYDEYPWEKVGEPWPMYPEPLIDGELPFDLGIYETWTAFRTGTFANFWGQQSGDALGVFIDKAEDWQDHEYADHVESEKLRVKYFYRDRQLSWVWPLARGSRSTCIAFYDHAKDIEAMHDIEKAALGVTKDGVTYSVGLIYGSHTHFLQNRYGTLDLNCVKDWQLRYADNARRAPVIFSTGQVKSADELEQRVMAGPFVGTLPVNGTRQNGGASPLPGKGIVNFSPVPSRQVQAWWVDGFNRLAAQMTPRQRQRLTAMYLFMAYVHAGEEFMPLVPMLSGHPNFLADVKAVPPAMSFLFPEHSMAAQWADLWQKCVEINTRYNTRPDVALWDAHGGRWTENLGTYVWAFLRPSVRSDFLLRNFDGVERFVTPQLAEMADWLVNALSAPYDGETPEAYKALQTTDRGHEWGVLAPGRGPRRVHPPQGAHADRRVPPRAMWYLGTCLMRYAPLAAEYAMWAARPTDQDMETAPGSADPWDAAYRVPDNRGTDPHLRSRKYTGYGIVMRAAVGTPQELSVHLQQIDEGPNYRWGRASEGGCGVIYFFADGKSLSSHGTEDVGDRDDQDVDYCSNTGVYKDGEFRSIGQNVLSRPFYDLNVGQFAVLVPRGEPGAYSAPEYVSRSVLLAGHDYFVVYDAVVEPQISHRFSWFVRRGDEMPSIQFVRGASPTSQDTHRTEIETAETTGFWMDGMGDSMAVISHRKDLQVEARPFGCRVRASDFFDLVFDNPDPVHFSEGELAFSGTAGLLRGGKDEKGFALFHGTRIGVAGFAISTTVADLGISGTIAAGRAPQGEYYAPQGGSIHITFAGMPEKAVFYSDGAALAGKLDGSDLVVELKPGRHHWELTDQLPVPIAPTIQRTQNGAGTALVLIEPVAGAAQYRVEISKDNGATWLSAATRSEPAVAINGLAAGQKIHAHAIALNAQHESAPGAEYPIYASNDPPPPPDGLHVELADGAATLTWGAVLGVSGYKLYVRAPGEKEFQLLAHGLDRNYVDKRPEIRASLAKPDATPETHPNVIEYCVTAVNGNGEGARSHIADTNPGSWRNWDPMPGEPFRRVFEDTAPSASIKTHTTWPRYYPR